MNLSTLMPRRNLLKSLAGLVALPGASRAGGPEVGTGHEPPAGPDLDRSDRSQLFDIPGPGVWRIDLVDGVFRDATLVPRWDLPWIVDEEQPRPVHSRVSYTPGGETIIVRSWDADDVPKCGLCWNCGAFEDRELPGLMTCVRFVKGCVPEADAPLYQEPDDPDF